MNNVKWPHSAAIFFMAYGRFFLFICVGIASFLCGAFFSFFHSSFIDLSAFNYYSVGTPSVVLDDEGREWARFQIDQRTPIPYTMIPRHVIEAFIAAEDHTFWHHTGISVKGIIRSILINVYHGRIVQGASTITQQLVKLLFFDGRKTFVRKFKEQLLALYVERHVSKEHILQMYLNHVYFGCGIYGIEAASQRFWKKSASDLSIEQAATLAGIVRSPQNYCPLLYPYSTQKRRNVVLRSMQRLGFLTQEQLDDNLQYEVSIINDHEEQCAPHAKEAIRLNLEHLVGKKKLYTGGLIVQTTINRDIQQQAQKAFEEHFLTLKEKINPQIDGALLSLEVETGEIKAMIGGANFIASKFNRALQAKRQFGSIFKPVVFSAAIQAGYRFDETEVDEPLEVIQDGTVWKPQNYTHTFEGKMTLARALSHSNNIVTIKMLMKVGIEHIIKLARTFHLSGTLLPYPSLALGCVDGTLKEAASLFNTFANDGVFVEPYLIRWVKDSWGTKIWKHSRISERILSSYVNSQVTKVLSLGMERYRKRFSENWLNSSTQAIGKTGTTNDCRTCWFCGSTPSYTTVLYIGCDDNRSMGKHVYPIQTAFPIWLSFNRALNHLKTHFTYDSSLKEILINDKTGYHTYYRWNKNYISILVPA